MAANLKLTDAQVKKIRRRVMKGEHQSDLAVEFGVSRKTIRRRLDALEVDEADNARRAAERARRQRRGRSPRTDNSRSGVDIAKDAAAASARSERIDPYSTWLDTPKNLSGRASQEARGLVRIRNREGTITKSVDREDVDALMEDGWTHA